MAESNADLARRWFEEVWNPRRDATVHENGQAAFDDGAGEVSGTWVTGRPPSREAGLLFYIMVDSVAGADQ